VTVGALADAAVRRRLNTTHQAIKALRLVIECEQTRRLMKRARLRDLQHGTLVFTTSVIRAWQNTGQSGAAALRRRRRGHQSNQVWAVAASMRNGGRPLQAFNYAVWQADSDRCLCARTPS
jgi:hypothetical protein